MGKGLLTVLGRDVGKLKVANAIRVGGHVLVGVLLVYPTLVGHSGVGVLLLDGLIGYRHCLCIHFHPELGHFHLLGLLLEPLLGHLGHFVVVDQLLGLEIFQVEPADPVKKA